MQIGVWRVGNALLLHFCMSTLRESRFVAVHTTTKRCDQDSHGVSEAVREGRSARFLGVNEVAE
eukprot:177192-Prymnesium_polylepis.1